MPKTFSLKLAGRNIIGVAKSRFFQITGLVSILFLAMAIALPVWRLFPEITQTFAIPLHYNIHSGVDLFGSWQRIFTIPIISGIILVLNTIIGIALWKRERVLSYFFFTVSAISQVLSFVAMIFVVLLNLSYG